MKKYESKIIRSKKEKVVMAIAFVYFVVHAFTLVYPFFFLLTNSFKTDIWEMIDHPLRVFPKKPSWSAYPNAMKEMDILPMFFNTITLAVGETFVTMALGCMAAYILAKYDFKGNSFIYTFVIIASVVPTVGAEPAMYKLMAKTLGLRNTYIGMLVMCGGFGGSFLYLHSFFKAVPWTYAESAFLDGASDFRVFIQIMIPLARNGIMTFTILSFMGFWNDYWKSFLYYNSRPTLSVGLSQLSSMAGTVIPFSTYFAGTIICIIPVIIFYAIFSRRIMSNLMSGGIKE